MPSVYHCLRCCRMVSLRGPVVKGYTRSPSAYRPDKIRYNYQLSNAMMWRSSQLRLAIKRSKQGHFTAILTYVRIDASIHKRSMP